MSNESKQVPLTAAMLENWVIAKRLLPEIERFRQIAAQEECEFMLDLHEAFIEFARIADFCIGKAAEALQDRHELIEKLHGHIERIEQHLNGLGDGT